MVFGNGFTPTHVQNFLLRIMLMIIYFILNDIQPVSERVAVIPLLWTVLPAALCNG